MPSTGLEPPNDSVAVASPNGAFQQLWSEALRKFEQSMSSSQWRSLVKRMDRCREAEDVCLVLDDIIQTFERFRGSNTTWGKLRNKYLKPAIEVLLLFNDAIAETAASFPKVPGGKAVFAAFGVLLQATKGVSAYCDALTDLFEELNGFLESLRPRLHSPSGLGPASKAIAIAILAHLLDITAHTAKLLLKRPWLGRLALYGRALLKDTAMQGALQRLRALTDLEVRAMTSEIRVDSSESRILALETRDVVLETHAAISQIRTLGAEKIDTPRQLLSELQMLNQDHIQAVAARGRIARGVDKLIQSQKDLMASLRIEREHREKIDVSRIYAKLAPVDRADINAQSSDGCMKGTRVRVLRELHQWSHDRNAPRIFWLNGMAGTGKSAIARSFCHLLRRDKLLGGSFFCSRGGSVEEGDAQRIIPTLAASMATHNISFNKSLLDKLNGEPFSIHWNLALQIERLLKEHLSAVDDDSPMLILVVDALDECSDEDAARDLLSELVRASGSLPVKFFLTSRPEPHIRQQLEALDPSYGEILRLHDIEEDIVAADISLYLSHGLRAMREPSFPNKWPYKADISALTRLSGKLFIYAFTALQYLRKDPIGRLPKLTGTVVTAGRPLTQPLDEIYSLILSEAIDPEEYEIEEIDLTRRIIAIVVSIREPMTVESLGKLLEMPSTRLRVSLTRLHAVIYVPIHDNSGVLSTFHASFNDFLTTPNRAPEHMRGQISSGHTLLATVCIEVLQSDDLHFNVSQATSSYLPNTAQKLAHLDAAVRYACLYWSHHAIAAAEAEVLELEHMLEQVFIGPKFLFWLEALSAIGLVEKATDILRTAQNLDRYGYSNLSKFLKAAINFTEQSSPAFAKSAPHVYLSALSLCSPRSIIGQCCSSAFSGTPSPTFSYDDIGDPSRRALFAVYSPDGTSITVGTKNGVRVYRKVDHWMDPVFFPIEQGGSYASCSRNGAQFAYSCSSGNMPIGCYSLRDAKLSLSRRFESDFLDPVNFVTLSQDGSRLASGSSNTAITVWDAATGKLLLRRTSPWHPFRQRNTPMLAAFSPNGKLVACIDYELFLFEIDSQKEMTVVKPFGLVDQLTCIDFATDGTRIVCGSSHGTICLWEVSSGEIVARFKAHPNYVTTVAFSPDGSRLVSSCSSDQICTVRVWEIRQNGTILDQPLRHIEVFQPMRLIDISPDNSQIVCTTSHGTVQLWDIDIKGIHDSPDNKQTYGWDGLHLNADGWLCGQKGELLLWLCKKHRTMLPGPQYSSTIHGDRLGIDWTGFVAKGTKWTKCYTPEITDARRQRRGIRAIL